MKKNNLYISAIIVLSLMIVSMVYLLQLPQTERMYELSVVVPNSDNNMWERFEAGLRQASDMYPININFVNTSEVESLEEQNELIQEEIKNGADGVVVQFMKSTGTEKIINSITNQTHLALLFTDVEMYDIDRAKVDTIMLDNALVSTTVTSMVFDDLSRDLRFKRIGILASYLEMKNIQERLDNIVEIMEDAGATIEWVISGSQKEMQEQLQYAEPPSFIIGLNSLAMDSGISYAKKNDIEIYGIGCSDENVYELDQGVVQAMVVPDAFMAGYQCGQTMYRQLTFDSEKSDVVIDFNPVNQENMFSKINENILFPIGE